MMNADTLSRYESVASQLTQTKQGETWDEKKRRVQHLNSLMQQMQSSETTLFGIADDCGDWRLSYAVYSRLKLTETIKMFVEGARHFAKYEGMTSGELKKFEQERTFEGQWFREYRRVEEHKVSFGHVWGCNQPKRYDHVEKQVYDDRYLGWLSTWRSNKDTLLYRLCRALEFGGVADDVYNTINVRYIRGGHTFTVHGRLLDGCVLDEYKPLVDAWYREQVEIDNAHAVMDAAAEQLAIAANFVCLWYALRHEKDVLEDELRLVGELPPAGQQTLGFGLNSEEQQVLNRLMPFFNRLTEQNIRIQNKGERALLTIPKNGNWEFATIALCAYVGNLIKCYLPSGEGMALISKLSGIDNSRLHKTYSRSLSPRGWKEVEKALSEFDKTEKSNKKKRM